MTEPPLSELYADCESALRLFHFVKKAYDDLISDVPEHVRIETNENIYIYQTLQQALEAELTPREAYDLCALVEALKEDRGGNLW